MWAEAVIALFEVFKDLRGSIGSYTLKFRTQFYYFQKSEFFQIIARHSNILKTK